MELQQVNSATPIIDMHHPLPVSTDKPFIQANTIESSLDEIRNNHIIPVFIKDNEPVISHYDFIDAAFQSASEVFAGESILTPAVRLSHPIKGRIPEAKNKPASELLEHEKTLYYERMAFIIEVPSIHDDIDGSKLSLTLGGVKSLSEDNLYSKKGADEHFKVFIGFNNTVCTNLCVWSDGYHSDLKVKSIGQLKGAISTLFHNYNATFHMHCLRQLCDFNITEKEFANLIGRCRMYQHIPRALQNEIQPLQLGDNQVGAIVRDFYKDDSFCRNSDGEINLWKLYNLFTGANKSSYIDNFLDRSANSFHFVDSIRQSLKNGTTNWFLN
jgi:hypothetical protein